MRRRAERGVETVLRQEERAMTKMYPTICVRCKSHIVIAGYNHCTAVQTAAYTDFVTGDEHEQYAVRCSMVNTDGKCEHWEEKGDG